MSLLARLEPYVRAFGPVGLVHAARSLLAAKPFEVTFRHPEAHHPVSLRLKTSDLSTFLKIFVDRDYDFPLRASPEVIVDAGANVGLASIWYASRFPLARIIAIEPEASNFGMLRRNVGAYPNVVPVQAALWGRNEPLVLVDPGSGHWAFRTEREGSPATTDCEPVQALTVDRLLAEQRVERIDLLKVDIEGAEAEVFADASAWIDRVDAIVVELHDRMKPGCSQAVFTAAADFPHRVERGENVFLARDGGMTRSGATGSP